MLGTSGSVSTEPSAGARTDSAFHPRETIAIRTAASGAGADSKTDG